MRTLISNGTVVTAEGSYAADVLVDGEAIAQIGAAICGRASTRRRDDRRRGQVGHPRRDRRPHPHGAAVRRDVRQGHLRDRHARRGVRRDHHASSTSPSSRAARACATASTPGTRRPRATPSPTTGST